MRFIDSPMRRSYHYASMQPAKFRFWSFPLFWFGYLAIIHFTMGLRSDHFLFVGLLLAAFAVHPKSRQWALDFFPFAIFAILYDFLRVLPKEWAGNIHIVEPYQIEVTLFSWLGFGDQFLPTEFFVTYHHAVLDVITSLIYSVHVIIPLGFATILWLKKSKDFDAFRWGFFAMNLAAFATYVIYPAAPPWYVTEYGFENLGWEALPSAAGLLRVDQLIGTPYFQDMYGRSAWLFGAIPSMHAAFPVFMALFARRLFKYGQWFFYFFSASAAFAAVYLNHHYFIDVLAGWIYAVAFYVLFAKAYATAKAAKPVKEPDSQSLYGSVAD